MGSKKILLTILMLPLFWTGVQYGQRVLLFRRIEALPLGISLQDADKALGGHRPIKELHKTFPDQASTDAITYGFGMPLALLSQQAWELEFDGEGKLFRKDFLVSLP